MGYFQNTAVTNVNALLDYFDTQLVAAGWTQVAIMNSSTTAPGTSETGKEYIWETTGASGQNPTRATVGMCRGFNGTNHFISLYGATANRYSAVNAARSTTVVTVDATSTPSPAWNSATAPITNATVRFQGTSTAFKQAHEGSIASPTDMATVTSVTDADTLVLTSVASGTVASEAGKIALLFNMVGTPPMSTSVTTPYLGGNLSDSTLTIFGYANEYGCFGVIVQGGNWKPFGFGVTGRGHIPAAHSDTAFASQGTSFGGGAVTITLDRNCSNLISGLYVTVIDRYTEKMERVQITAKPALNQITVTLTNTYSDGALIGEDPCPLFVWAQTAPTGTTVTSMASTSLFFVYNLDGTRTAGQTGRTSQTMTMAEFQMSSGLETDIDPDALGYLQGSIVGCRNATYGWRYPLVGCAASALGTQNDYSISRTTGAVAGDYRNFVSILIGSGFGMHLAIGPGAN